MGVIKSLEKFDIEFFTSNPKQADVWDPKLRKLVEVSYEAVFDAGIPIEKLRGTNTGVFVGVSDVDTGAIAFRSGKLNNLYGLARHAFAMMANRKSFIFGLHGPSYVSDAACAASAVAIQEATNAIRMGLCDSAIVAGACIRHDPLTSKIFFPSDMLSVDGKCKVFDNSADTSEQKPW
ncbi:unnamed protein product [Allacma fusca]|uniref:Ketosynthase family 3 (KS3) domain-containing protein n=1 Tax=Allacma fusca TaxID=39272 RepID=A0A8J2K4Z9_9HEXA|nr:unnamed protein product [Allacma fusca]